MKKEKRKPFYVTLSPSVYKDFENFCKKNCSNKSRLIEWVLLQYIEGQNKDA